MKPRFAQQDLENVYFDKSAGMYDLPFDPVSADVNVRYLAAKILSIKRGLESIGYVPFFSRNVLYSSSPARGSTTLEYHFNPNPKNIKDMGYINIYNNNLLISENPSYIIRNVTKPLEVIQNPIWKNVHKKILELDQRLAQRLKNTRTAAEYRGDASEHEFERLEKEVEKHIRGTGRITFIRWDGVGDDHWTVVLDTEYAALKLWYTYRHSNPPPISKGPKGWVVAI